MTTTCEREKGFSKKFKNKLMTTVLRCFNVPDVFETVPSPNGILPIAVAKHVLSTKDEDPAAQKSLRSI
jgi:hypothetical protein